MKLKLPDVVSSYFLLTGNFLSRFPSRKQRLRQTFPPCWSYSYSCVCFSSDCCYSKVIAVVVICLLIPPSVWRRMNSHELPYTRVFVSGLPPNLTSDQLRAHFSAKYHVTDAVVLPKRRIGFVGFKNHGLAQDAIKYFDKTYIRLSKISVVSANPVWLSAPTDSYELKLTMVATDRRPYGQLATKVKFQACET